MAVVACRQCLHDNKTYPKNAAMSLPFLPSSLIPCIQGKRTWLGTSSILCSSTTLGSCTVSGRQISYTYIFQVQQPDIRPNLLPVQIAPRQAPYLRCLLLLQLLFVPHRFLCRDRHNLGMCRRGRLHVDVPIRVHLDFGLFDFHVDVHRVIVIDWDARWRGWTSDRVGQLQVRTDVPYLGVLVLSRVERRG